MNHLRLPDVWLDSVKTLPPSSALSLVVNLDLNLVGGVAALPADVAGMHDCCLVGPFFLQVQAACDLTITDEQRRNRQSDKNSIQEGGTRMLKLCLTDGRQQLVGIEYRRLTGLHTDPPHGLKLVLSNVAVRRGVLLLTPDCAAVVGGGVGSGVMAPGSARPSPTGTAAAGGACGSHGISALPPPPQATSADPLAGSVGAWGCMDRQQRGGRAGDDEDAALFGEDEPSPSAARSRSTAEPEEAAARPRKRQSYSPPQPGAQSLQPQPAGQPPPYQPTPRQQSPCQPAPLPHHSGARLDWQHTAYPQPASRPSPPPAAIPISATARAPAAEASTGPFPSPGATRPADCASSAPGAPSPHRVPVAETTGNVGQPPLSLEAALLWGAGTPPMSERVRLEAVCQKVVKLSVDELRTSFAAEVLLSGGACERALPICEMLVASMFGCPAHTFYDQLNSEDKSLKKAAKAKAKEINAKLLRFTSFELAISSRGLTIVGFDAS